MKITAIKKQKKNEERYSIFIDGQYKFSLSELELIKSRLKIGDEITKTEIDEHGISSIMGKVLETAYYYLSFCPRSTKEVADYLNKKYDDREVIDAVIVKLKKQKYLDDNQFAKSWVIERQQLYSKQRLQFELAKKGIQKDIIDESLGHIESNGQIVTIKKLIKQKRLRIRYQDDKKLIRYLGSQGFRYGEIKQALEELVSPD